MKLSNDIIMKNEIEKTGTTGTYGSVGTSGITGCVVELSDGKRYSFSTSDPNVNLNDLILQKDREIKIDMILNYDSFE